MIAMMVESARTQRRVARVGTVRSTTVPGTRTTALASWVRRTRSATFTRSFAMIVAETLATRRRTGAKCSAAKWEELNSCSKQWEELNSCSKQ